MSIESEDLRPTYMKDLLNDICSLYQADSQESCILQYVQY